MRNVGTIQKVKLALADFALLAGLVTFIIGFGYSLDGMSHGTIAATMLVGGGVVAIIAPRFMVLFTQEAEVMRGSRTADQVWRLFE